MKVVQITTSMELEAGGPPRVVAGIASAFGKQGCPQVVLATHGSENSARCIPSDCLVISTPRCQPRSWYMSGGLDKALVDHAREASVLHLHEVWSYPQYLGARYGTRSHLPYILTPHGELGPKHMRHKGPLHHLKKRAYLQTFGRRVVFGASCVHVFSEAEAEGVRAVGYRGPVAVVPNGIDLAEFATLPDARRADERWPELAGRRVVLFMSRLSPEKGLCRLIPAWKELVRRESLSDAILVLAGPSDRGYGETVQNLIDEHGVAAHVLQTGMVTGDDRLQLLSRADVYTLPSFSEGFSMSLLEAMACGNAIVYTPNCNFPEAAEAGAGFCVEPTVAELHDAIAHCLELGEARWKEMGRAGQQLIRTSYTWEAVASKMRTVYQCLVDSTAIPRHPPPFGQAGSGLHRVA